MTETKKEVLLVVSGILLVLFFVTAVFSISTFIYVKRVDQGSAKLFNGLNQATQNIAQRLVTIENTIKPATK